METLLDLTEQERMLLGQFRLCTEDGRQTIADCVQGCQLQTNPNTKASSLKPAQKKTPATD